MKVDNNGDVPPVETPPVETPPVETPPVETPPVTPPTPDANKGQEGGGETPPAAPKVPERVVPEATSYVVPDGFPKELGAIAKELDYTQEQLDGTLQKIPAIVEGIQQQRDDAHKKQIFEEGKAFVQSWGEVKKTNLILAKNALLFGDKSGELKKILDTTGYANHPAALEFLRTIGELLQEGGYLESDTNTPTPKVERAHRLYPNDVPK